MEKQDFEFLVGRIEALEKNLDEHAELVAQRAAEKVWELIYVEVGRNTIRAAFWIVGLGCLVLLAWLGLTGKVGVK